MWFCNENLRLCFRICKKPVFLIMGLIFYLFVGCYRNSYYELNSVKRIQRQRSAIECSYEETPFTCM